MNRLQGSGPCSGRPAVLIALAVLAVFSGSGAARTQDAGEDSSSTYWGTAAYPDTAQGTFRNPSTPLLMGVIYWPVRVVAEPVILLADGLGSSVDYLSRQKVIQDVSRLLGAPRGPITIAPTVQAGGLSGFGGGIVAQYGGSAEEGTILRARLSGTVNGDTRATLGSRFGAGTPRQIELGVGYRMRANARYFGIGPSSSEADESFYRQELYWVGGSFRRSLGANIYAQADLLYSSVSTGEPREGAGPSITQVFAGNLPPGYGERSYGVSAGIQVAHQDDPHTGRPTHGGSQRVHLERFDSTDGEHVAFWNYRAELQQFFTLWHPYRVLALRGFGSWLDPSGSNAVPFQRLMVNSTPDALRGFESFRFRDSGMLEFSAEYRFPLWVYEWPDGPGLDLYPLADVGQVFGNAGEIALEELTLSYGLGIRIVRQGGFVARLEYAQSNEENVFRLSADQIFQFDRLGFLFGRDPTPSR